MRIPPSGGCSPPGGLTSVLVVIPYSVGLPMMENDGRKEALVASDPRSRLRVQPECLSARDPYGKIPRSLYTASRWLSATMWAAVRQSSDCCVAASRTRP